MARSAYRFEHAVQPLLRDRFDALDRAGAELTDPANPAGPADPAVPAGPIGSAGPVGVVDPAGQAGQAGQDGLKDDDAGPKRLAEAEGEKAAEARGAGSRSNESGSKAAEADVETPGATAPEGAPGATTPEGAPGATAQEGARAAEARRSPGDPLAQSPDTRSESGSESGRGSKKEPTSTHTNLLRACVLKY